MMDTHRDTAKNRNAIKTTFLRYPRFLADGYRKNEMSIHSIH